MAPYSNIYRSYQEPSINRVLTRVFFNAYTQKDIIDMITIEKIALIET